jgi:hypothetical protein
LWKIPNFNKDLRAKGKQLHIENAFYAANFVTKLTDENFDLAFADPCIHT